MGKNLPTFWMSCGATKEKVIVAFKLIWLTKRKGILINIFGGIMR